MIYSINHFSFTVSDLEKSIDFYQNILGLSLLNKTSRSKEFSSEVTGIKDAELYIAYLSSENCSIELIEYTNGKGLKLDTATNNIGSSHICFNVVEFDNYIEHLNKHNVKYRGKLCLVPEGPNKGNKVVYAMDPDGNTIEFIEKKL